MERIMTSSIALMNGPEGFQLVGRCANRGDTLLILTMNDSSEAIKVLEYLGGLEQDWYTRFEFEFIIGKFLGKV